MARLSAQAKGLFYPTPLCVMDMIAERLGPTNIYAHEPTYAPYKSVETRRAEQKQKLIHALDPCVGDGAPMAKLAAIMQLKAKAAYRGEVKAYGVELNTDRVKQARDTKSFVRVINSDSMKVEYERGSFQLLFLNPPYDFDAEGGRIERRFLRKWTQALDYNGVLILVIPRSVLHDTADFLASRYTNLHAFSFPKEEYEAFSQVVVMAYKQGSVYYSRSEDEGLREWADETDLSVEYWSQHHYRRNNGDYPYAFPFTTEPLRGFREVKFDFDQAVREAGESGLLTSPEWRERVAPSESELRGGLKSLMPLRRSYLVQLLTSGEMGTIYAESANGGPPVLVAGGQMRTTKNDEVAPGVIKLVSTFKPVIRVFDLRSGEYLPALA